MRCFVVKAILTASFFAMPVSLLAQAGPVVHWRFDDAAGDSAKDAASEASDHISGTVSWMPGVEGGALHFDGFSTSLQREASKVPVLHGANGSFSVDTWVVVQSYPWSWLAVAEQRNQDGQGFSFGLDEDGHIGLQAGTWGRWEQALSAEPIPLNRWTHIAAVYDAQQGITLYINGKPAGGLEFQGAMEQAKDAPLMIGRNITAIPVAGSVRHKSALSPHYSLDGALDELQIYDRPQSPDEVQQQYAAATPSQTAVFPARHWPVLPGDSHRLQAAYTNLKLYPEWDAQWRMGSAADVVVSFPDMPFHIVFWRGSNYGECMVTENGIWVGDQSFESSTPVGTAEHMNDKFDAQSHVSVLESSDARVVVHWRYALVDVAGNLSDIDPATGWGNWVDEYFYIYPDGVAVRNGTVHGTKYKYSFTEPALLLQPAQKPEDLIQLEAATVANQKGESKQYSWTQTLPAFPFPEQPVGANIAELHTKSEYKPFYIYQPGVQLGPYGWPPELRPEYSHFPVWDHWPVNFIPSDGRFALHADHFSSAAILSPNMKGTWIDKAGSEGASPTKTAYFLFGLTKKSAEELAALDRSWLHAPAIKVAEPGVDAVFDTGERAYVVTASGAMRHEKNLRLTVMATAESPMVNAAIVVRGWSGRAGRILIDGKAASAPDVLTGVNRRLEGDDLIVWIRRETQQTLLIEIVR